MGKVVTSRQNNLSKKGFRGSYVLNVVYLQASCTIAAAPVFYALGTDIRTHVVVFALTCRFGGSLSLTIAQPHERHYSQEETRHSIRSTNSFSRLSPMITRPADKNLNHNEKRRCSNVAIAELFLEIVTITRHQWSEKEKKVTRTNMTIQIAERLTE